MLKNVVFIVGLVFGVVQVAHAEPLAEQSAPVDALAELSKLPEGDILIIEHSLAALYYYPNVLTGKPSTQLVNAIKQYQKDNINYTITGMLDDYEIHRLMDAANSVNFGGVLRPMIRYGVTLLNDGAIVQISGTWLNAIGGAKDTPINAERIVCFKDKKSCFSAHVQSAGRATYVPFVTEYEIKEFTKDKLVAVSERFYHDSTGKLPANQNCTRRVLSVDLIQKSAIAEEQLALDRKDCLPDDLIKSFKGMKFTLVDGHDLACAGHFMALEKQMSRYHMFDSKNQTKLFNAMKTRMERR